MTGPATVADALRAAADRLAAATDTARLDAELLMAHALGCTRSDLLLRHMRAAAPGAFAALVERRLAHEPVAYITGAQEFFGREFAVAPGVLIPRADSETLVVAALDTVPSHGRVLDCGVGPGTLLLTVLAEMPTATGVGIDRSGEALAIARANTAGLGLADRAGLLERDWSVAGWADGLGLFDLVLANPPYVETSALLDPQVRGWEPAGALFAGPDGLDDYRLLIPQLPGLLAPGGAAVVEIGATQAEAVSAIAQGVGFAAHLCRDLGGRPRALILRFQDVTN
ncbi:MAG: hypothetical protein RLZZ08_15 [Pseudomonadota bacterium]|jgi:release factor glutamine methyltransferase